MIDSGSGTARWGARDNLNRISSLISIAPFIEEIGKRNRKINAPIACPSIECEGVGCGYFRNSYLRFWIPSFLYLHFFLPPIFQLAFFLCFFFYHNPHPC